MTQSHQEYTIDAIDDRLFRMERLAYECILNHPESKGFCTEIQHISKELREAIRSPHHTSTPPDDPIRLNTQPEGCDCRDCQRYRKDECPYPGSNPTIYICNSFLMDVKQHDTAIRTEERNKILRLVESDEWQKEHDEQTRNQTLDKFKEVIRLHDEDELLYPDLYNEFLVIYKSLRKERP